RNDRTAFRSGVLGVRGSAMSDTLLSSTVTELPLLPDAVVASLSRERVLLVTGAGARHSYSVAVAAALRAVNDPERPRGAVVLDAWGEIHRFVRFGIGGASDTEDHGISDFLLFGVSPTRLVRRSDP